MKWVDVAGPPGVGKSTLCDPLWGPHDVQLSDAPPPPEWHDFINEISRLFSLVQGHPSFVASVRMTRRSVRKMAAVKQMLGVEGAAYIQTGFVQRGLGFGWRLSDMNLPVTELYHFFRLMPVSIGVVFLDAKPSNIVARNRRREDAPETAHENRSHMVEKMIPVIKYAKEVFRERGVLFQTISTELEVEKSRGDLIGFADKFTNSEASYPPPLRLGRKTPFVSAPVWW